MGGATEAGGASTLDNGGGTTAEKTHDQKHEGKKRLYLHPSTDQRLLGMIIALVLLLSCKCLIFIQLFRCSLFMKPHQVKVYPDEVYLPLVIGAILPTRHSFSMDS